ncbi:hypothetical protein BDW02DRAFT_642244 [Decorospora gaudefroyi]|uniref:Uncharacterized protein n=1 Tax=Decorospora gaudefroyi TaxID=184978 RepID=A0A6A5K766_9PLEO|nr:hypothetical protein BDW02DRAFT_642244 [Decorospora gaudefroyi]
MKSAIFSIAKIRPQTFKVTYSPEYKSFIINHIATDPSHPLYESQKRRQAERKREGLWWHVTTGIDLNKSSCVRAWARRRLRTAITEELKQRGYDENGKFVNLKAIQDRMDMMSVLRVGKTLDLTGSLRLIVQPPLVPAKYADVRAETGKVIEALVEAVKNEAGVYGSMRNSTRLPRAPFAAAPQSRTPPQS